MEAFWDARYDTEQFVYGKSPNLFFASVIDGLKAGKILLPGEGEGRNGIYAAIRGWKVHAFDQSRVGYFKAKQFAAEMGVQIEYLVCGIKDYHFPENCYDAVGLIFVHPQPEERRKLHLEVCKALKPGGKLMLEGFHLSQLKNDSGGPRSLDMLFDEEILREDFSSLEMLRVELLSQTIHEGTFHQGEAALVRLTGQKPIK